MRKRRHVAPRRIHTATDANPWAKFTESELETKLTELRKLIDSGLLTERSLEHQFAEVGIIENELASRNGG